MVSAFPDDLEEPGVALIDPRLPRDEIASAAADLGYADMAGTIDVREPSLLPDTVEADALAVCCLGLCKRLCDRSWEEYEPWHGTEARQLFRTAQQAIRDKSPLDDCYRLIEKLAACDAPRAALGARHFLEFRRRLPPLTSVAAPIDETDADHIADAFIP